MLVANLSGCNCPTDLSPASSSRCLVATALGPVRLLTNPYTRRMDNIPSHPSVLSLGSGVSKSNSAPPADSTVCRASQRIAHNSHAGSRIPCTKQNWGTVFTGKPSSQCGRVVWQTISLSISGWAILQRSPRRGGLYGLSRCPSINSIFQRCVGTFYFVISPTRHYLKHFFRDSFWRLANACRNSSPQIIPLLRIDQ